MDYEREHGSDTAGAPAESETQPSDDGQLSGEVGGSADLQGEAATAEGMPEQPSATDASAPGEPAAVTPEWPAADLVGSVEAATDASAQPESDTGSTEVAATMAPVAAEPVDIGDDSDAPIHLEDAPMAAETPQVPVMPQHVSGENINLSQGGVQSIKASSVTLSQGGAGRVRADEMTVQQGGVGLARAGSLTLQSGSSAFAVVADEATVEEGANTFLVVSRSFSGDVRPTIDWRTGLAFGAGLGLVLSILRRLR